MTNINNNRVMKKLCSEIPIVKKLAYKYRSRICLEVKKRNLPDYISFAKNLVLRYADFIGTNTNKGYDSPLFCKKCNSQLKTVRFNLGKPMFCNICKRHIYKKDIEEYY